MWRGIQITLLLIYNFPCPLVPFSVMCTYSPQQVNADVYDIFFLYFPMRKAGKVI